MHLKSNILLTLSASFLFGGCATKKERDPNAPVGRPSATFWAEGGSAAYYASASGGKGILYCRGGRYGFTFAEVGAGGTGAQAAMATGEVYNLDRLSDFAGTYTGVRSGFTILQGKRHAKLTNNKGVVIYVEAETTGLASSTGASTVTIKLQ